ncbi:hypothetical protein F5144DRAFT_301319 [Chaetomium tenue]|uniref:Uncharacterized protein n=1 Tax=Chaetomium tenue TaxID=1854479 RepID=A0ACB7P4X3_9PEZI|nr:hypothetical protein F5144DRAFT_301319 [Chaetomium globosum]
MKTILFLLTATGIAFAQNLSGQPDCATACIISAISAAGCGASDLGCQCGPTQSFIAASAAPCLLSSCTGTQLIQAQSAGAAQCSSYSATAASNSATTTPATRNGVASSTSGTAATPAEGSETSASTPAPTSESAGLNDSSSTSTGAAAAMATPAIMGAGALLGAIGAAVAL